jgi:catecholate siderophore receptor
MDVTDSGQVSKGQTNTLALYAFDSMEFSPQWQLTGGLRVDRYRTSNSSVTAPNADGEQTHASIKGKDTLLSGKVGVVFKPADNGSVYAAVSTSQQPPGGSNFTLSAAEGNINNPNMDPSKATNVEVGTKWELLDKRLLVSGAVFRTTVKNDLGTVDQVTGEVTQYGKKQVQGIELSAVGQITPAWNVSAGLARMTTKVKEGARGSNGNPSTQTGAAINWSPKLTFTAWSTYRFNNGLTVGGGARYVDSVVRSISNTAQAATTNMLSTPDYWVFDAYLGYQINKNVDLQLNVYNLANKKYIASLNNNGGRYIPGAARSVLLTANVKF